MNKPSIWDEVLTEEEVLIDEMVDDEIMPTKWHSLIVHNDEVNTFDWVIESLVEICGHNEIQAEQCAMIIHYNGKTCVKTGERKKLTIQYPKSRLIGAPSQKCQQRILMLPVKIARFFPVLSGGIFG